MSRMSLNNLVSGRLARPQRVVIYGVDGIGKSSFAAASPRPIFISAEDGTAHLDVTRFPNPESWQDILDAIGVLYHENHDFQTLVIDSADWAEQIARDAVCIENNVPSVESIPYGKGWVFSQEKFIQLLRGLDALYAQGMNVIVVAHAQVKAFNDPEHEAYDRYSLKLDKRAEPLFREWADYVLFANWDTRVEQKTDAKGKPLMGVEGRAKAKSFGKRLLFTQRSAAFDAKRRFNIPDRLNLDWGEFWAAHQAASGDLAQAPASAKQSAKEPVPTKDDDINEDAPF